MEVSPGLSPAPIPQSSLNSPGVSRKRSRHEVEDAVRHTDKNHLHTPGKETQVNIAPSRTVSTSEQATEQFTDSHPSEAMVDGSTTETTVLAVRAPGTTMDNAPATSDLPTNAVHPAAKKRKLSPASKEAKEREREEKERQRLEQKAKKEEEKRIKEEERNRREEKRKMKEEEKRKREEEKMKKEMSQMRLSAFFTKPAMAKASDSSSNAVTNDSANKGIMSSSIATSHASESITTVKSDYQREFPDFFLQSHTTVAPANRFRRDAKAIHHVCQKLDACLKPIWGSETEVPVFLPTEIFHIIPYRRRGGRQVGSVRDILLKMQDEATGKQADSKQHELLQLVKMKLLKFSEDVRPPYQGTWTKALSETSASKLSRNPFYRGLPDTNYDYDSEAEWEEPEEGEDLGSDEEEEGSDEGDDDMEGFLDDDDDHLIDRKRRLIVGDLEPVCIGVCWQENGVTPELQAYKIEPIWDSVTFPIDPFSTAYWHPAVTNVPDSATKPFPHVPSGTSALHAYAVNTSAHLSAADESGGNPYTGAIAVPQTFGRPKRPFPPELLDEFKQTVEGSDLTKTGLIEILKKRFPKVSKETLKDTLNHVAVRVGQREAEKKWVCKS